MLRVVASRARSVLVDAAEARDVAQQPLVVAPEPARPDHRPVVEADGRERPADLVDDGQEIAVERAEHVLRLDDRAGMHGLGAHAYVRRAVHRHHAVGARTAAAEETAWPVVLEAAREDAYARRVQRRSDRVAREPRDGR